VSFLLDRLEMWLALFAWTRGTASLLRGARQRPVSAPGIAPARPRRHPAGPVAPPGLDAVEGAMKHAREALLELQAREGYWLGLL